VVRVLSEAHSGSATSTGSFVLNAGCHAARRPATSFRRHRRDIGFGELQVAAHWVEYAKGVLLFVMAPDDDRSGAFYVYDRERRNFWLLEPADGVFGGYSLGEMRRKIRAFRLLDFAQNPACLR